jgi:heavy metal efflux system protein
MIARLVAAAVSHRWAVLLTTLLVSLLGVRAWQALPVDAVPDVTNVQVQVLTGAPGLSPLEVEALVTRPVELSLSGLPRTTLVRSVSRAGVSAVTVIFADDFPLADARAVVAQRLPAAREAVRGVGSPELGPMSTGLGEVLHFTMSWPGHTSMEVRTLLDWEVAYALRTVPGVVEVNAWGGDTRQVEVLLRPADLLARKLTQEDVETALLAGGRSTGGGAIERGGEQAMIRLDGAYRSAEMVGAQVVATHEGIPILVRDVATVSEGAAFRLASATADGEGETVYAMVQMLAGGNAHAIVGEARTRLAEIEKRLPKGVVVRTVYDRAALVDRVLATVRHSLLEGGAVVIVVLLLLLGDLRAGLVVATVIPLAMLGAFALMSVAGTTGNLMSLGAIDFGLVVDGAVVVVEGALAGMAAHKVTAGEALLAEAKVVGRPLAYGVVIVAIVYVPVLLLEGVEGKLFRPMALTVLFALAVAVVLTFTWVPALASLLLGGSGHAQHDPLFVRSCRRVYEPVLAILLRRPALSAALAAVMLALGVVAGITRGVEFVPRLEEGDLVVQVTRPPSVSLREANAGTTTVERTLQKVPEVRRVVSRTGSPDVATDIMGLEQSDVFVLLKPRSEWRSNLTRETLVNEMAKALDQSLPGTAFSFTQPIEMRTQELLGGTKSDLGLKIFGDDLAVLERHAGQLAAEIRTIPGAADVRTEQLSGLPLLTVRPNPERAGRVGLPPAALAAMLEGMKAGRTVGSLVEGERRFAVRVLFPAPTTPEGLGETIVPLPGGARASLGSLADVVNEEGPAVVSREGARRRVLLEANVRGRDLGSFVRDVNSKLAAHPLPPGYHVEVAGQYEHLVHAAARFAFLVPGTLIAVFVLLYLSFGEGRAALVVLASLPIATSGGFLALAARGLPLSVSAVVGLLALFGVATLNGSVLVAALRERLLAGEAPLEAAAAAARSRFRPVLTTAMVAAVGFVPMAVATGTGAEVQRPLATVVIGGLITATILTLGVLPSLGARVLGRGTSGGTASTTTDSIGVPALATDADEQVTLLDRGGEHDHPRKQRQGSLRQTTSQQLPERAADVDGGENADDLVVLHHDRAAVLVLGHRVDDFVEGGVRADGVDRLGHRVFDGDLVRVDLLERLDEAHIAIGEHSAEDTTLEDGEVADVVLVHEFLRLGDRLVETDRVGRGGHVVLHGGDGFGHAAGFPRSVPPTIGSLSSQGRWAR